MVNIEHRLRWWLPTKEQGKGQEEKQEVAKAEGEADRGRQRGSPRGAGRSRWRPTAAQARSCRCGCCLQASRPGQGGRSPRFSYRIIRVLVACPSKVAQMKAARCCYMWVLERSESDENWNYAVRKTRREPRYRIQYDSAENSGSSLMCCQRCADGGGWKSNNKHHHTSSAPPARRRELHYAYGFVVRHVTQDRAAGPQPGALADPHRQK